MAFSETSPDKASSGTALDLASEISLEDGSVVKQAEMTEESPGKTARGCRSWSYPKLATPLASPISSPFVPLSNEQETEMAYDIAAMKMPPTTPYSHCRSCRLPSGIPTSAQSEVVQLARQFLDVLKSVSTTQKPPPPPTTAVEVKPEEPPTRTQKLEFKKVNEVFVFRTMQFLP